MEVVNKTKFMQDGMDKWFVCVAHRYIGQCSGIDFFQQLVAQDCNSLNFVVDPKQIVP